jgi:hypothetical protein
MKRTPQLLARTKTSQASETDLELIDYKEAARILGLSPKTLSNGGAGTRHLQHRLGPNHRTIRFIRSEVLALRDEWLSRR